MPHTYFWENRLDKRFQRYIQSHFDGNISGDVYKTIAITAAKTVYGDASHKVIELSLGEPLTLAESNDATLQIMLSIESEEVAAFQIFTRAVDQPNWIVRAGGRIQLEQSVNDWLYQLEWLPDTSQPAQAEAVQGHWLIFADHREVGIILSKKLAARNATSTLVYPAESYRQDGATFVINKTRPEDFKRLFADLGVPCQGILYLWGLDLPETDSLSVAALPEVQSLAGESALYLVQALANLDWSRSTSLWLITRGAESVQSEASTGVAQAPLWGFGRVVAIEQPALWGGLIDLPQLGTPETDAETLFSAILHVSSEDQFAYRDGQRFVARLTQAQYPADVPSFQWRSDATYLITGGLRGLGLMYARRLVEAGVRHLVLMGRSGVSGEAQVELDALKALGAEIVVAKADVAQYADVQRVLADIQSHMPPLRGIIHSAAVLDDATLLQLDAARFSKPMAAKVAGTLNLHLLTKDLPLDCFIVFSSFASLFGNAGQANYAAANAFMDALMHDRRAHGLPGLSINWGQWGEIGLAANVAQLGQIGLNKMQPKRAAAALSYLLDVNAVQTVVTDMDWSVYKPVYATQRKRPFLEKIVVNGVSQVESAEERMNFTEVLQQTPENERHNLILDHVRAEAASVLGFSPVESLDLKRGFFKMGMDSLMSVQLRNRLENKLGCFLPPTVALEYPTVDALTNFIADEIFHLASAEAPVEPAYQESSSEQTLEAISDDQLLAMLDDELAAIEKLTGDNE